MKSLLVASTILTVSLSAFASLPVSSELSVESLNTIESTLKQSKTIGQCTVETKTTIVRVNDNYVAGLEISVTDGKASLNVTLVEGDKLTTQEKEKSNLTLVQTILSEKMFMVQSEGLIKGLGIADDKGKKLSCK